MKMYAFIASSFMVLLCIPQIAQAQYIPPSITANGVAIYGWKDGTPTALYVKNETILFPIASISKIITATVVQELYAPEKRFTIDSAAFATNGSTPGILQDAIFARDDLLRALLISSSNDAATAFTEPLGNSTFVTAMNSFLHSNKYTPQDILFINPSGLDPHSQSIAEETNRMSPEQLSFLLYTTYNDNPLFRSIMSQSVSTITDLKTNNSIALKNTNKLFTDNSYASAIRMSKTGLTSTAKQNVVFVTQDTTVYDIVTVVIAQSTQRDSDSRIIIDWIRKNY